MVKSATITVKETGGASPPVEDKAPAVVKAKAEAIKSLAVDTKALRKDAYSNDNWRRRRKVIFASLVFFGALIAYLVFLAPDDELRRTMALPLVGAFVSIATAYFGFATLDDNNKRSTLAVADPVAEPE
jgi:hypothetical protein